MNQVLRKLFSGVLIALCAFGISGLLRLTDLTEALELQTLDARFRAYADPAKADTNIVIAVIDEQSLKALKTGGIVWKWPRDIYAALVRYFHRGGAKAIVFDIIFSDADINRLSSDAEETDGQFAQAMEASGNVVLASQLLRSSNVVGEDNPLAKKIGIRLETADLDRESIDYSDALLPIESFQRGSASLGAANYVSDTYDDVCRRVVPVMTYEGSPLPQLAFAAHFMIGGKNRLTLNRTFLAAEEDTIPLDGNGNFLLTWYGKGGPDGAFKHYSVGSLIASARSEELKRRAMVPSSAFKGKIVFIGSNAAALFDLKNTPFTRYEPYPGVEISATALSNLRQQHYLKRISLNGVLMGMGALALVAALAMLFLPLWISAPIVLVSGGSWVWWAIDQFKTSNVWVDFIAPVGAMLVAVLLASAVRYQMEWRERRLLRKSFNKYVSPQVVKEIIAHPESLGLSGKEIEATVLFCDLKGFTSISEQVSPQELVALLNRYFAEAATAILAKRGLVDKYIGDAVMALFGAPIGTPEHARDACAAALELQQRIAGLNQADGGLHARLAARIGINSGKMIVGNIGSQDRLEYTAIGDHVNLASRLEGANKLFGTSILLSESTAAQLGDQFLLRKLGRVQVKGKVDSVAVFELLAERSQATPGQINSAAAFDSALALHMERSFEKAHAAFKALNDATPDDSAVALYQKRCLDYLNSPPPPDWDGTITMETKQ